MTGKLSVRYTILVKCETILIVLVVAGCLVLLQAQPGLAAAQGIRAPIPAGWQWNQAPVALGGPLALNNFGSAYDRGGILPPGGAEIDLTRVDLPATPLREYIDRELAGATVESMGEIGVGGSLGMRVIWTALDSKRASASSPCSTTSRATSARCGCSGRGVTVFKSQYRPVSR